MSVKTGHQVEGDILEMLGESTLAAAVDGSVYREGTRPRDSEKEDIIVAFTTGLADQIQSGVVALNIYVPDIDSYRNGALVENVERTAALEAEAQEWVESLGAWRSCYLFELQQSIYTEAEPGIHQHYVVVKLKYRYFDE